MALETIKTTRLVGNLKIGDETVKQYTVDVNEEGVSTIYESMYNSELYAKNRSEMRNNETELLELHYKIEDEILAELEAEE